MILDSADMTIVMNPEDSSNSQTKQNGQLKELQANGNVAVSQGARKGRGDHLVYEYTTDRVTLTSGKGRYVAVDDPIQGASADNATSAQWTSAKGTIILTNESGGKVQSNFKTK
jgi:lipopolysaccharide export system protein LptA